MHILKRLITLSLLGWFVLGIAGCSSTKMKLSGTAGATFTGRYQLGDASHDLTGSIPLSIEIPGQGALRQCEFRKAKVEDTLILEIYHGRRQTLRAPAEAGTVGVRASGKGKEGWSFEILR